MPIEPIFLVGKSPLSRGIDTIRVDNGGVKNLKIGASMS
jgi:hypothetical protein